MLRKFIKEYSWLILSFALAAATLVLIIPYIRPAQIGSFEYVRKGEDLFHKGRIKESIKYFEKAYAASPENKDIRTSLIYAYAQYGNNLADANDYDKAIECLARACDIEMSSSAVQNLAIMYSRRALEKLRKNNEALARKDLSLALETASCSESASRNLSTSLYNDAVKYFREGRSEAAILFLKESTLAYPNKLTFELLGDIYYNNTDLAKAHFCYNKALALDKENSDIEAKLQKTVKEMALASQEKSAKFPHFNVRYSKRMFIDEAEVEKILEKCYFDVGKDLDYFPASKTTVFFYSREAFKDVFEMPALVRAFYDGNIRIPFPGVSLKSDELSGYIYHEYTHAVVSAKTDNNCPVWFSEGLAVWEEYRGQDDVVLTFFSKSVYDSLSLDSLEKAFRLQDQTEDALRSHYLLAYSVVKYIIDNWGMEGIRNILTRIKNGQHFVNAVEDEFLLSEKEFESRWRHYAFGKYLTQARSGVIMAGDLK